MSFNVIPNAVPIQPVTPKPVSVESAGYQAVASSNAESVQQVVSIGGGAINQNMTGGQGSGEEVSEHEADRRMKSAVDQANEKLKSGNRELAFSYNEKTKRISIKVFDSLTKEIIREIPPEKTIEMLERVYDLAGIMVDEKR